MAALVIPKVGLIVHYFPQNPAADPEQDEPRAAIVTKVPKMKTTHGHPHVGLCVLNPNGNTYGLFPFAAEPTPGHWTYIPQD